MRTGRRTADRPHGLEDQACGRLTVRRCSTRYSRDGDPANADDAMTIAADGTGDTDISQTLDRHVEIAAWMPDGRALSRSTTNAGPLYFARAGSAAQRCRSARVVDAQIDTDASRFARRRDRFHRHRDRTSLGSSTNSRPGLTRRAGSPISTTTSALQLGRVDGQVAATAASRSGVVTYPPDFDATRKADPAHVFPLVLRIHGGPTLTSLADFEPFYHWRLAGYVVFAPNYRGSSNFGTPSNARSTTTPASAREPTSWPGSRRWKISGSSTRRDSPFPAGRTEVS